MAATGTGESGLSAGEWRLLLASVVLTGGAALTRYVPSGRVAPFVVSAIALGVIAALVGRSVDHLGERLRPGPTGVVHAALSNLPELFFAIFALRAGLITAVQSALVGSVLANLLLVLGLAFVAGGLRHGPQHFDVPGARNATLLLLLAVAILIIPTFSAHLDVPIAHHEVGLSNAAAGILFVVFVLSIVATLRADALPLPVESEEPGAHRWSVGLLVAMLVGSSVAAAAISAWFVDALTPALGVLHISQAFAGLVVVAIAGNAVENVVGIRMAWQDRQDYAVAVILQSPVQIALGLVPLLVLFSPVIGGAQLTLVFPVLLVVSLAIGTVVTVAVVNDGESTWIEGAALIGLYAAIAAAFWKG